MSSIFKPTRTMAPEPGNVFFAMPYGVKVLSNGQEFDFDEFYREECVPVVREDCAMSPVRVDGIYGSQGVLEAVWQAMQQADLVVVDFSGRSANVAFEFGWALLLGKRIVLLTQDAEDIPSDVRGLYRYITYSDKSRDMRRMREELALQLKAMREEAAEEMAPMPMPGGAMTSVAAKVIHADQDYVVVRDERGRCGVMRNNDVEYCRLIKDMRKRFPVGTNLDGAFVVDPMRSEMRYTLLGGEVNPWPLLARRFPAGRTFRGRIANSNAALGAFVQVEGNINGLVGAEQFGGSVPSPGTELEITVVKVDESRRRVSLRLVRVLKEAHSAGAGFAEVGWRGFGEVVKAVPEADGRGGFVLVRVPGASRPALLLAKDMTADLRADLNNGHVETGEEIYVEVRQVDTVRNRTLLGELPEPEDPAQAA
ncbi:hypothetical protein [Amycolatopsis sp. NPDC003731]